MKQLLAICLALALATTAGCTVDPDDNAVTGDTSADTTGDAGADAAPDTTVDTVADPTLDPDVDADPDSTEDLAPDVPEDADGGGDGGDVPSDGTDAPPDDAGDVADTSDTGDADASGDAATDGDGSDVCGARPGPDISSAWLVVGTGFLEFEATDNCANVPIILGPQGGAHIWGAFQVGNFDTGAGSYFYEFTFTQDGEVTAELPLQSWFTSDCTAGTGSYSCAGYRVILDELLVPEDQLGIPGVLHVRFWRDGGIDLEDEVVVIPNDVTF